MKCAETKITVAKGEPLLIEGNLSISLADGTQLNKSGTSALCRCGASANKPYCDGIHAKLTCDA